jgi:uncharacterized protein
MTAERFSHRVSVRQIPETGRHFKLEADAGERQAVAEALGIVEVEELVAELDLRPIGSDSFAVTGTLAATVVQTDVVTLEPVRQHIEEAIDLTLVPAESGSPSRRRTDDSEPGDELGDRDVYQGGQIDLGPIVFEHLALGLDPYPRSPGVEFSGHVEDKQEKPDSPFAALANLKRNPK